MVSDRNEPRGNRGGRKNVRQSNSSPRTGNNNPDNPRDIEVADERGPIFATGAMLQRDEEGEVVGRDVPTPGRPYGASDVIRRGTAQQLKYEMMDVDEETGQIIQHPCLCGCGGYPANPTSLFRPGHDSKVRAMGLLIQEGRLSLDDVPERTRRYIELSGMLERGQRPSAATGRGFRRADEGAHASDAR